MKLKIDELRLPNENAIDELRFPGGNSIDELRTPDRAGSFDQLRTPANGFGGIDELRIETEKKPTKKEKAVSYERYFGEMGISRHQVAQRVALAKDLEADFDYLFYCMNLFAEDSGIEGKEQTYYEFFPDGAGDIASSVAENSKGIPAGLRQPIIDLVEPRLRETIDSRMEYTPEMQRYVINLINILMDDTKDLSNARAVRDAKNEANTVYNIKEFNDAVSRGKTMKTWHTMEDEKVRETHVLCDRVTVPIADLFPNGLLYPHDPDGAPEEVIQCRCYLTYR